MLAVVADPDNTTFSESPLENTQAMTDAASAAGGTLGDIYEVQVNGEAGGYAVTVSASGSQGSIEMMVGVDAEGAVTGVSVVNHLRPPASARRSWATNLPPPAWVCWTVYRQERGGRHSDGGH
ncbi:MAG: hypothetical protein ACLSUM_06535 [Dysosmobacter welbionis]